MIVPVFLLKTPTGFMAVRIELDGSHRELLRISIKGLPDSAPNMSVALIDICSPDYGELVKFVGKVKKDLVLTIQETIRSYEIERIVSYEKEREFFENLNLGYAWDQLAELLHRK